LSIVGVASLVVSMKRVDKLHVIYYSLPVSAFTAGQLRNSRRYLRLQPLAVG
jgi:hypothetical protein